MKALLAEIDTKPKKSFGQNYLVNEAVIEKTIATVALLKPKFLVEIGPGLGSLTRELAELSCPLVLIELDRDLVAYWLTQKFNVMACDALKVDWSGISQGAAGAAITSATPITLVSNLPFEISSTLLVDLSTTVTPIKEMVLMFQKEVAQRIQAKKRTSEYGLLSVISQSAWTSEKVCDANPSSFFPPPRIAGRVMLFRRRVDLGGANFDGAKFLKFVKAAFAQRRKYLCKNLATVVTGPGAADRILAGLAELGHSPKARAEELDADEFVRLFKIYEGVKA